MTAPGTAPRLSPAPVDVPVAPAGPVDAPRPAPVAPPPVARSTEVPPPAPDPYEGLDLPRIDPAEPYLPGTDANTWDIIGAGWTAANIQGDVNGDSIRRRARVVDDMFARLPDDVRHGISNRLQNLTDPTDLETLVLQAAQAERQKDPGTWAQFPATAEDLTAQVTKQRRADLTEAQAILDQPGGAVAEFLGGAARNLLTAQNVLMMPLGGGTGSALKTIGTEMLLGAAGNVVTFPQELAVASEMGLPKPNLVQRLMEGAAAGGIFAGLAVGVAKAATLWHARTAGLKAATPMGVNPIEAELAVDAAEGRLTGDLTPQERMQAEPKPGQPPVFDFGPRGNASPKTNRIGYVYGKLIEGGMTPEQAAGFVGNFMVESGPSLNPAAVGDGGNAYGIAQWNDRRDDLIRFAAQKGKDWHDLDTQIAFLFQELNGKEAAAWARIREAKTPEEVALAVSEHFERPGVPHNERRVAFARSIAAQVAEGRVPKWEGAALAPDVPLPPPTTRRAYTTEGQVTAGDYRVDVRYEVVDAATLRPATAELQPRDRTTAASDAQIAKIAAELDPLRLMPNPEAQSGAPIVGPDNVVESGNGRAQAIQRAYDLHPDRAEAYAQTIQAAGFAIPEGVTRPVLIARRTSALTPEARSGWVAAANIGQIARMTPAEMARVTAARLDTATLDGVDWSKTLTDPANGQGLSRMFGKIPPEERGALAKADGSLNALGEKTLRDAVFAAAWDDPGLLDLQLAGESGALKSLIQALQQSAPAWAAMRAEIRAGRLRPEFDITGFVQEAMGLIAEARRLSAELAGTTTPGIEAALKELLSGADLFEGAISPLTRALVRKMWREGRAAPASEIGDFLTRYATEARKVGDAATGDLLGQVGPRDVLAAIDAKTFGDLPQDLGRPRARPAPEPQVEGDLPGFDQGAASPEAIEADRMMVDQLVPEPPAAPAAPPASLPVASPQPQPAPTPTPLSTLDQMAADFADLSIDLDDGTTMTARDIIDDLRADEGFDAFIQACAIAPGGAQ